MLILLAAFGYAVYVVAARKTTSALRSEPVAAHVFLGAAAGFVAAAAATGSLPVSASAESIGYAVALAWSMKTGRLTFLAAILTTSGLLRYSPGEKASTACMSAGCLAASTNASAAE